MAVKTKKRNSAGNAKKRQNRDALQGHVKTHIIAVILIAVALFLLVCLKFTEQTGFIGTGMSFIFKTLLGAGAIALPFFLLLFSAGYFWPFYIDNLSNRRIGLLIGYVVLLVYLHLRVFLQLPVPEGASIFSVMIGLGLDQIGGGILGAVITAVLYFLLREIGSYIVIVALGIIALLLITNSSFKELFGVVRRICSFLFRILSSIVYFFSRMVEKKRLSKASKAVHSKDVKQTKASRREDKEDSKEDNEERSYTIRGYIGSSFIPEEESESAKEEQGDAQGGSFGLPEQQDGSLRDEVAYDPVAGAAAAAGVGGANAFNATGGDSAKAAVAANAADSVITAAVDVNINVIEVVDGDETFEEYKEYQIPSLDLLPIVSRTGDYEQQKLIHEKARALENTFESFGVKVKIKEIQAGPAVTRYEIQPDTGVKVSKILSLSDDLALNLAATGVRIEAPIPGKAAIGIEVPNKNISPVFLREVLEDEAFLSSGSPLLTALGKDITGVPVFADLIKMPHLLVAGSTGSGKSVCINSILCSILFKASPKDVKLVLIDPKIVELNIYNGIPHLYYPVVTDAKNATLALRAMVKEMERRYELFAQSGVRDIAKYNEYEHDNEDEHEDYSSLPYIVVIIDELADLMMVAPKEVEDSIVRLSQMARAAGIHLVIATQRPSVDVITGLIKANIPSRIAFAVSSSIDSRTILDAGGAEKLLGRGDMLYHPIGSHKLLRVQGAFISEDDIANIIDFIKQQENPIYQHNIPTIEETENDAPEEETDELMPRAIELILEVGQASTSMIQRRFKIGYNRAARIVDDMERLGIIGKPEGSKPRQILIRSDQIQEILNKRTR